MVNGRSSSANAPCLTCEKRAQRVRSPHGATSHLQVRQYHIAAPHGQLELRKIGDESGQVLHQNGSHILLEHGAGKVTTGVCRTTVRVGSAVRVLRGRRGSSEVHHHASTATPPSGANRRAPAARHQRTPPQQLGRGLGKAGGRQRARTKSNAHTPRDRSERVPLSTPSRCGAHLGVPLLKWTSKMSHSECLSCVRSRALARVRIKCATMQQLASARHESARG